MHKTKRRHSAERRARQGDASALARRAQHLARDGNLKAASHAVLIAERLHRLESKLRIAKRMAAAQHARAAAAIAEAQRAVDRLAPPPVKPEHRHFLEEKPDGFVAEFRRRGLIR